LGIYERGWRAGIQYVPTQRLQGLRIDRGRSYAIEGLGEPCVLQLHRTVSLSLT
jgi:hypothetical protein